MFPNLQFQDKALDLKYKPTFLIFLSQIKLMVAGLATFFQREEDVIVELVLIFLAMLLLSYYNFKYQPCLIKTANIWQTSGYLALTWVFGSFIFYFI
jgi:hypothetical protein